MKTPLALMPLVLIALTAGCKTLPDWITPVRIEAVTRLAAYSSAKALLIKEPESRPKLEHALAGFRELEAAGKWDLATAAAIAASHGLDWLASPEGNLTVTGGVMFLDLILGREIELSGDTSARAFVLGARSGLELALSAPAGSLARSSPSGSDPTYARLLREAQATRTR